MNVIGAYRISLVAPRTEISSHILNVGELFMRNGLEHFISGGYLLMPILVRSSFSPGVEPDTAEVLPSLTVRCHQGQISLQGPRMRRQDMKTRRQGETEIDAS